jgi:hypothetical protein
MTKTKPATELVAQTGLGYKDKTARHNRNGNGQSAVLSELTPVKVRFHENGLCSLRIHGRWVHDLILDRSFYYSRSAVVQKAVIRRNGFGNKQSTTKGV